MTSKIAPCLWFDGQAEDAAKFYQATFPDSHVRAVHRAPGDFPGGKQGDVLTVEFTVLGMPFLGLNGGPEFKFDEAVSFQVSTEDQAETDRYWNAIIDNGGSSNEGGTRGQRAFEAMMTMSKIDIAALDAAVEGIHA